MKVERIRTEARRAVDSTLGRGVAFTHQPLGRHIDPSGLAGYYCDFRHKADHASLVGDGLPRDEFGRLIEYVIPVAQTALGYWEHHIEGREDALRPFLRLADWLVDRAEDAPSGLVWRTSQPVPKYAIAGPWASAMGQGEAISVLLRAHRTTGNEHYLQVARAAMGPIQTPVGEGGLLRHIDGHAVLEEYPAAQPVAVLNGWLFALFGVHELGLVDDGDARRLFAASSDGLLALLPRYDVGWWSRYSLCDHGRPDLAKPFYQRLHVVLLRALHLIRPVPVLIETADRWEAQIKPAALARVSVNKLHFRIRRGLDQPEVEEFASA